MSMRSLSWRNLTVLFLIFWSLTLLYVSNQRFETPAAAEDEKSFSWTLRDLRERLGEMKKQSDQLLQYSSELRPLYNELKQLRDTAAANAVISKSSSSSSSSSTSSNSMNSNTAPQLNAEHERLRRRVDNGLTELGFMLHGEIERIKHDLASAGKQVSIESVNARLDKAEQSMKQLLHLVQSESESLAAASGASTWRQRQLQQLEQRVNQRILSLQEPRDCSKAKKIVCNLNKGCGFGCQAHHVLYCLIVAYSTNRTFVLESFNWRYSRNGWTSVFKPISSTCNTKAGAQAKTWGADGYENAQVIELPIIDTMGQKPKYLPQAVPTDIANELAALHGNPFVWFAGVLLQYVLRPNELFKRQLEENMIRIGFSHPIVGVQVRRTDKIGTEAAFHDISEYMRHVADYYSKYEIRHGVTLGQEKRKVLLATDDANLLAEAKRRYPTYRFISDSSSSRFANVRQRYSDNGLRGVVSDIVLLSQTDFIVCTFSSQVCRLAYELMQVGRDDASGQYRSLDDVYYYGGQQALEVRALYGHNPTAVDHIQLRPGDVIGLAGNHWDGFSLGVNRRTGRRGLFPSFNTELIVRKSN